MATILETIARNAAADAVVDLLDGGSIEILQSNDTLIVSIPLPTPAFGNAAAGVATANAISEATVGAGVTSATAAKAVIKNSASADIITGLTVTQTGGGGEIELSDVVYSTGSGVQVTSATYTQPAS